MTPAAMLLLAWLDEADADPIVQDAVTDSILAIEAEAATRAVDEALSVERVARLLGDLDRVMVREWLEMENIADGIAASEGADSYSAQDTNDAAYSLRANLAAALVAHLRGPRPEGEG